VSVTVPGMPQTIHCVVEVGDKNLANPSIFSQHLDITFAGDTVTFSEKNTFRHPGSVFVPYTWRDKSGHVLFTWEIGDTLVHHVLLDTGTPYVSMAVNPKVANRLGIDRYPPVVHLADTYNVPVSLPYTSIRYISKIHVTPDSPIRKANLTSCSADQNSFVLGLA